MSEFEIALTEDAKLITVYCADKLKKKSYSQDDRGIAVIYQFAIFNIALAHIMLGVVYQNAFYLQQNYIFNSDTFSISLFPIGSGLILNIYLFFSFQSGNFSKQ